MAVSRPSLTPYAQELSQNALDLARIFTLLPSSDLDIEVKQLFADALKVVWAVMCAVSALGLGLTFFTEEFTLDEPVKDDQYPAEDMK
jgi:ribonuclease PH